MQKNRGNTLKLNSAEEVLVWGVHCAEGGQ